MGTQRKEKTRGHRHVGGVMQEWSVVFLLVCLFVLKRANSISPNEVMPRALCPAERHVSVPICLRTAAASCAMLYEMSWTSAQRRQMGHVSLSPSVSVDRLPCVKEPMVMKVVVELEIGRAHV